MSRLHDTILDHFQNQNRMPTSPATVQDVLDVAMILADSIDRLRDDAASGGISVRELMETTGDNPITLPVERKPGPTGQSMQFIDFEKLRQKPEASSRVPVAPTPEASH